MGLKFGQDQILSRTKVDYCTIDQIKQFLYRVDLDLHGISGEPDDEIKFVRSLVKGMVNGHCHTEFDYVKRVEWVSGQATSNIMTRFYPVVNLEQIRVYNIDYQTFFQYSGDEMILTNRAGIIEFPPLFITSNPFKAVGATLSGFTFFPGRKNIQLIYSTGFLFDEVPTDFSVNVAKWCAGELLRTAELRISEGSKTRTIAGVVENYGKYFEIGTQYIEEAKEALNRYRRIGIWTTI